MRIANRKGLGLAGLALGCALAMPAAAQDAGAAAAEEDFSVPVPETVVQPRIVTARDPVSVRDALQSAGYPAKLATDGIGDPMVETELGGYSGKVMFYGCDEELHTDCRSLQLVVGLDRRDPMPPALANTIMKDWRYLTVTLDEEGDPWFMWDIVTGDGIATSIFLDSIRGFSDAVAAASSEVFKAERDSAIDLDGDPATQPLSRTSPQSVIAVPA